MVMINRGGESICKTMTWKGSVVRTSTELTVFADDLLAFDYSTSCIRIHAHMRMYAYKKHVHRCMLAQMYALPAMIIRICGFPGQGFPIMVHRHGWRIVIHVLFPPAVRFAKRATNGKVAQDRTSKCPRSILTATCGPSSFGSPWQQSGYRGWLTSMNQQWFNHDYPVRTMINIDQPWLFINCYRWLWCWYGKPCGQDRLPSSKWWRHGEGGKDWAIEAASCGQVGWLAGPTISD